MKSCDNCGTQIVNVFIRKNDELCEACYERTERQDIITETLRVFKRYNGEKLKDIPNGDVKAFYSKKEESK